MGCLVLMQDFNPASSLSILSIVPVVVYSNADILKTTIPPESSIRGTYFFMGLRSSEKMVLKTIKKKQVYTVGLIY